MKTVPEQDIIAIRARRSAAARKAAATRKLAQQRRREMLADMTPGSPFVGSRPVDGDIGATLARIRKHLESRS